MVLRTARAGCAHRARVPGSEGSSKSGGTTLVWIAGGARVLLRRAPSPLWSREGAIRMVSLLLQLGPPPGVPVVGDPGTLTAAYQALVPIWIGRVWPYSQEIFGALALLDLAFLGWNLMRRHGDDVRGALLGMTNRLLLIGLFLDLMLNGPAWMGAVIDIFVSTGKAAGNVQIGLNPSSILLQGLAIAGVMLGQASLNNIM